MGFLKVHERVSARACLFDERFVVVYRALSFCCATLVALTRLIHFPLSAPQVQSDVVFKNKAKAWALAEYIPTPPRPVSQP